MGTPLSAAAPAPLYTTAQHDHNLWQYITFTHTSSILPSPIPDTTMPSFSGSDLNSFLPVEDPPTAAAVPAAASASVDKGKGKLPVPGPAGPLAAPSTDWSPERDRQFSDWLRSNASKQGATLSPSLPFTAPGPSLMNSEGVVNRKKGSPASQSKAKRTLRVQRWSPV
ncbi:hypothetical protein A4X09_0g1614 [Tilletia walkeri]|uniref:Uncharacterized protein n=1 Tax=Tilletia walkeri TaxID=117179 RepID=A0A8X7NBJ9_9BASI|nr:hypothetical protein A4X09_0g1614 [Tilletia walkeri]